MSVNQLTLAQLDEALHRIVWHPNFVPVNAHLTDDEIANLRAQVRVWPRKPVLTPFAHTHSGYSQIKIAGVKYSVGRVVLRWARRGEWLEDGDLSHTQYLGPELTSQNIHPAHLTIESNLINRTRVACMEYYDQMLFEEFGLMPNPDPQVLEEFLEWMYARNVLCWHLHIENMCTVDYQFYISSRFQNMPDDGWPEWMVEV
ncbi:hypothetical protein RI367_004986 [Sorochytrium milnesiophthora]